MQKQTKTSTLFLCIFKLLTIIWVVSAVGWTSSGWGVATAGTAASSGWQGALSELNHTLPAPFITHVKALKNNPLCSRGLDLTRLLEGFCADFSGRNFQKAFQKYLSFQQQLNCLSMEDAAALDSALAQTLQTLLQEERHAKAEAERQKKLRDMTSRGRKPISPDVPIQGTPEDCTRVDTHSRSSCRPDPSGARPYAQCVFSLAVNVMDLVSGRGSRVYETLHRNADLVKGWDCSYPHEFGLPIYDAMSGRVTRKTVEIDVSGIVTSHFGQMAENYFCRGGIGDGSCRLAELAEQSENPYVCGGQEREEEGLGRYYEDIGSGPSDQERRKRWGDQLARNAFGPRPECELIPNPEREALEGIGEPNADEKIQACYDAHRDSMYTPRGVMDRGCLTGNPDGSDDDPNDPGHLIRDDDGQGYHHSNPSFGKAPDLVPLVKGGEPATTGGGGGNRGGNGGGGREPTGGGEPRNIGGTPETPRWNDDAGRKKAADAMFNYRNNAIFPGTLYDFFNQGRAIRSRAPLSPMAWEKVRREFNPTLRVEDSRKADYLCNGTSTCAKSDGTLIIVSGALLSQGRPVSQAAAKVLMRELIQTLSEVTVGPTTIDMSQAHRNLRMNDFANEIVEKLQIGDRGRSPGGGGTMPGTDGGGDCSAQAERLKELHRCLDAAANRPPPHNPLDESMNRGPTASPTGPAARPNPDGETAPPCLFSLGEDPMVAWSNKLKKAVNCGDAARSLSAANEALCGTPLPVERRRGVEQFCNPSPDGPNTCSDSTGRPANSGERGTPTTGGGDPPPATPRF